MDGYLRIQAIPARRDAPEDVPPLSPSHLWPDAPDDVLFVDVEPSSERWPDRLVEGLRHAPEESLLRARLVVVRATDSPHRDELVPAARFIEQRWQVSPHLAALHLGPGMADPVWTWVDDPPIDVDLGELAARCRCAELEALLHWGSALWTPTGYHYRLPSGEHRATFVRLADAIRQPRDADVLAWWLLPHFVGPNRALVLDSSSLMPLVLALRSTLAGAGITLGNVGVRDAYPETPIQDRALIEHVGGEGIVAVVSVSSSGTSVGSLAAALEERRSDSPWRLEVLVSRDRPAATRWSPSRDAPGLVDPWFHLPSPEAAIDPEAPHLVIDPQTFANTVIPEPAIATVLDPPNPDRDIEDLLTFYSETNGVGVECDHHGATIIRRGKNRGAIRFYPERLLVAEGFVDAAASRLRRPTERMEDGRPETTLRNLTGIDAVVVLEEDLDLDGFGPFLEMVTSSLADDPASVRVVGVPRRPTPDDAEGLRDELGGCRKVLVLGLGLVTGGSVQDLDIRVLQATTGRERGAVEVVGLVVHARPASFDEWQAARSSFHGNLAALWVTYLPWRSPLQAEIDLLNLLPDDDVESFLQQRYDVVNHEIGEWAERCDDHVPNAEVANPGAVLWAPAQDAATDQLPHLLGGSRFGHEASMAATYVGVAAVMQRARLERRKAGGPPWLRFDLTKTNFTYFEAIIIASILRWLRPSEGQWDSESKDVGDLIREMWHRAATEGSAAQQLLIGELLLAAASGKVPREAFALLKQLAEEILSGEQDVPSVRAGLALLDLSAVTQQEAG